MELKAQPGAQAVPRIRQILSAGGSCFLTVTGNSMAPFLHHERDAVVLAAPEERHFARGQILFFERRGGGYILHRVRRVLRDGSLVMNGDAQAWVERIRRDQVVAAVVAVRRKDGSLVDCGSLRWRLRSAMWYPTRPLRPLLFRLRARLRGGRNAGIGGGGTDL